MPKKNRKGGKQSGGGSGGSGTAALLKLPGMGSRQNTDDERDTADNWSTASIASEDCSLEDSVGSGEAEDTSAQEQLEDQLKECIDNLSHKSAQTRKVNLSKLHNALQLKYLKDFLQDRRETVLDALEKCIRRGKGDEQAEAAMCLSALMAQIGNEIEMTKPLESVRTLMTTLLLDNSTSPKAREEYCRTLAFCDFIMHEDEVEVRSALKTLSEVFKGSLPVEGGTPPSQSPEVCSLVAQALESWCLLLTMAPPHVLQQCRDKYLDKLNGLLRSPSVDLRIAGGEAIVLVYELTREYHESFEGNRFAELCELLRQLATDSQKHRSKKDRRVQRASFREILRFIQQEGELPENDIKFGSETMYLTSWEQRLHYQTFCDVLGSGINTHLKENELARAVFGLGDPLPPGVKMEKLSKVQRNIISKERGRLRAKQRDKRTVTANGY